MEPAARWRIGKAWRRALKPLFRRLVTNARQARDQMGGIGMLRPLERLRSSAPPPPAGRHRQCRSGESGDCGMHGHVVGHEDDRRAQGAAATSLVSSPERPAAPARRVPWVGSSAMMNSGSHTVASAMVRRWRMPPDDLMRIRFQYPRDRPDPAKIAIQPSQGTSAPRTSPRVSEREIVEGNA